MLEVTKLRQAKIKKIEEEDFKKRHPTPLRQKAGKTGRLTRLKP